MQVLFESSDPQGAQLRELALARVRFVLRRLVWLVLRARVQLVDANGPRGGVDKRCRVEIRSDDGRSIVITSVARDWRCALDAALSRARRALVKARMRSRSHSRPHPRALALSR